MKNDRRRAGHGGTVTVTRRSLIRSRCKLNKVGMFRGHGDPSNVVSAHGFGASVRLIIVVVVVASVFWSGAQAGDGGGELGRLVAERIGCGRGSKCDRNRNGGNARARDLRALEKPNCTLKIDDDAILASCANAFIEVPSPDFVTAIAGSVTCRHTIRNIVFVPNATVFYYIHHQECFDGANKMTRLLYSFKMADLEQLHRGSTSSSVLSYWWNFTDPDGLPIRSPSTYVANGGEETIALVNCMDLSKDGKNLVLTAESMFDGAAATRLTLLGTVYGNRSSFAIATNYVQGLTFNPSKTKLYVSDVIGQNQIFVADVAEQGRNTTEFMELARFDSANPYTNISTVSFTPYSLVPDESCLYFTDYVYNRVWGFDSYTEQAVLAAGTGEEGMNDGDGASASFGPLRDLVTTSDGCNVFVATTHSIRWLQLDSPCTTARNVTTIATYNGDGGLYGLAMRDNGTHMYLYPTTSVGHMDEIEINKSNLHACVDSGPSSPSSAPSPQMSSG